MNRLKIVHSQGLCMYFSLKISTNLFHVKLTQISHDINMNFTQNQHLYIQFKWTTQIYTFIHGIHINKIWLCMEQKNLLKKFHWQEMKYHKFHPKGLFQFLTPNQLYFWHICTFHYIFPLCICVFTIYAYLCTFCLYSHFVFLCVNFVLYMPILGNVSSHPDGALRIHMKGKTKTLKTL